MTDHSAPVATAFAPATVGNVAVGFDILGCCLEAPGDRVTVERIEAPVVEIASVQGVVTELPGQARRNTAGLGLVSLIEERSLDHGFRVSIDKGIPLGSGMGGSAASAVASTVAASALLDRPMTEQEQFKYALIGESAATGSMHADNITPCLFGGLTVTRSIDPMDVLDLPVPEAVRCIVVYPHRRVDTRRAREVIAEALPVVNYVEQSANLAGFITGCHRGDLDLIGRTLKDVLIEPHRASLIPGFEAVKRAAMETGALGASISGAGPTVFAWAISDLAAAVADAMAQAFEDTGSETSCWCGPISTNGAVIVDESSTTRTRG